MMELLKRYLQGLILTIVIEVITPEEYNLSGVPGDGYHLDVLIGHPSQKFKITIDTGSATLAIASLSTSGIIPYFNVNNSATATTTNYKLSAQYGKGMWNGTLASDFIKFPSLELIPEVMTDIGLITKEKDFFSTDPYWQGIMGMAYSTVGASGDVHPKTWLDSLDYATGSTNSFDLKLCGVTDYFTSMHYGSLRILDKHTQNSNTNKTFRTPILRPWWYEVGALSVRVLNKKKPELNSVPSKESCSILNQKDSRAMIVDSGTTMLQLPDDLFFKVVNELMEAANELDHNIKYEFWFEEKGFCLLRPVDWNMSGMPHIAIDIVDYDDHKRYFSIELPPASYIHFVDTQANSTARGFCYGFGIDRGNASVMGVAALEGLQVTFDRSSETIGFQTADCGPPVRITGPHTSEYDFYELCSLDHTNELRGTTNTAAYWCLMISLAVAMNIVINVLKPYIVRCFQKFCRRRSSREILVNMEN